MRSREAIDPPRGIPGLFPSTRVTVCCQATLLVCVNGPDGDNAHAPSLAATPKLDTLRGFVRRVVDVISIACVCAADLYLLLYQLSSVTGQSRYAAAADAALTFFLASTPASQSGLLPWGAYAQWDFLRDTWARGAEPHGRLTSRWH